MLATVMMDRTDKKKNIVQMYCTEYFLFSNEFYLHQDYSIVLVYSVCFFLSVSLSLLYVQSVRLAE